ncbi:GerAB/ArcD/ProY family transporter [Falsibacillus albus]|uniref:Spore gernimation protein GerB n=1 Tax=Falsibacillus albus TaxID=2478915 RepID=A0A3L7K0I3_9BACI|nr:GerAB/ArcD/ProY family transporter [Falsibacillus albus]RLQ96577.1 spore gernimation protein GerB [Falsibacillus albus]
MQSIPESRKISQYIVFFTVTSMQVGVGVLGFQRIIAKIAGYDAWMSILIAGIATHIAMFIIYQICEKGDGDLLNAQKMVFGKWIGNVFNLFFAIYFCLQSITVLRTYLEVIQVWMFPTLSNFWFSLLFLLLVLYIVNGGFRVVAGVSFFGTILPSYLLLPFLMAIPHSDYRNLLPVFNSSIMDILNGTYSMSLTYLGYETLLVYFPFIKEPQKSKKWAHLGLLATTMTYSYIAIITFGYFSQGQLQKTIWATLSLWKIVELPFVERFEYIGIANWCLIILPNICIALWCASRIMKRTFPITQRASVLILAVVCLVAVSLFETRLQINSLNDILGKVGFYLNFVYVPLLFLLLLFVRKVKKKS